MAVRSHHGDVQVQHREKVEEDEGEASDNRGNIYSCVVSILALTSYFPCHSSLVDSQLQLCTHSDSTSTVLVLYYCTWLFLSVWDYFYDYLLP